ncbi:MAG: MFS transporter [Acidaminococcaceae bacterium]|nr:MFS transporter [Acidaminococcaceae bacterium]MBQ7418834.1 MFS transporter [Acidaminococcaceae bacterium]MBQ8491929.1 MFS transporter [Acidaminococcaceae bacterium]MBQ9255545.1 MFS transporter [Acidaminococcaceae bacterium]MBQ9256193.1 MFS transporter [Acidaminococcaceae bacterium]
MKSINPSVYLFSLGHLSVDWCQGAIPALLPYFIRHYGLSYQAAGTLIFANVLIASVLQPLFGYYSDRISRPWFIPMGTLCCGTAVTLMGFCSSYAAVFMAALLSGIGSAIFHPEAALMVNRIAAKAKGQALGTFSVGGNAGFAIGPVVAGFCAYKLGIHSLLLFGVINAVLAAILFARMPAVLTKVSHYRGHEEDGSSVKTRENNWKAFGILFFPIFARSIGFTLSNTFIPIYWMAMLGATATQGTTALTILFTMGAFVTYTGGLLADRFGYVKIIRAAFFCMVPTYIFLTHSTDLWMATALLFPAALSIFLPYSPIVVLGQTYLAKNAGFASGVTLGLSTTIGGIFAPIVGWAADQWGLVTALQIFWIAGIAGLIAAFMLPEPEKE